MNLMILIVLLFFLHASSEEIQIATLRPWRELKTMLENKMVDQAILKADELKKQRDISLIFNRTIKIETGKKMPYVSVERVKPKKLIISGYIGEVWNTLKEALGFRSLISLNNRMVNERQSFASNGEIDVVLSPVILQGSDVKYFDYTMPFAHTWYHLYKKIDNDSMSYKFYFLIWKCQLWFALLGMVIFLTVYLWIFICISHKNADFSPLESFLIVLGATTSRGTPIKSNRGSVRILVLTSLLFGLIMTTHYSAHLVSKLSRSGSLFKYAKIVDDFSDQHYSLCVSTTGIAMKTFMENGTKQVNSRWRPIINRYPCSVGSKDMVPAKDYCEKKTIILESLHNTNYIWKREPSSCRVQIFPHRLYSSHLSILFRKGFPFSRIINSRLTILRTSGIISRLQRKWLPSELNHHFFTGVYAYEFSFSHVQQILHIYILCVLFCLLILLFELLVVRIVSKYRIVKH